MHANLRRHAGFAVSHHDICGEEGTLITQCPHCGKPVTVSGIGQKPLNIGVNNVCDPLRAHSMVREAAKKLGCSRGYIYKTLKAAGLNIEEVRT